MEKIEIVMEKYTLIRWTYHNLDRDIRDKLKYVELKNDEFNRISTTLQIM